VVLELDEHVDQPLARGLVGGTGRQRLLQVADGALVVAHLLAEHAR